MMRRRSGYTLIEMLSVMVVVAVVLSGLGASFRLTSLSLRGFQAANQRSAQLHRLASRFRADLHVAQSTEIVEGAAEAEGIEPSFHVQLPNKVSVRYRTAEAGLIRELRVADEITQREIYRIDGMSSVSWKIERDRATPLIALTIHTRRRDGSELEPIEVVTIKAALNIRPTTTSPVLP